MRGSAIGLPERFVDCNVMPERWTSTASKRQKSQLKVIGMRGRPGFPLTGRPESNQADAAQLGNLLHDNRMA